MIREHGDTENTPQLTGGPDMVTRGAPYAETMILDSSQASDNSFVAPSNDNLAARSSLGIAGHRF
jgi:hypothetical protein